MGLCPHLDAGQDHPEEGLRIRCHRRRRALHAVQHQLGRFGVCSALCHGQSPEQLVVRKDIRLNAVLNHPVIITCASSQIHAQISGKPVTGSQQHSSPVHEPQRHVQLAPAALLAHRREGRRERALLLLRRVLLAAAVGHLLRISRRAGVASRAHTNAAAGLAAVAGLEREDSICVYLSSVGERRIASSVDSARSMSAPPLARADPMISALYLTMISV